MKIVNCTPYQIDLSNGTFFEPSGQVARVSVRFVPGTLVLINPAVTCNCDECLHGGGCGHWIESSHIPVFKQVFGQVQGLPEPQEGTIYIVSAIVLDAVKASGRTDCVASATGRPDTIRNDKGHILSVPGFVN